MSLMEKLEKAMPERVKNPPNPPDRLMRIEHHPIRLMADQFAHYLDGDLPKDGRELAALLWVFGEQCFGEMERQVNAAMRIADDAMATSINPRPPADPPA